MNDRELNTIIQQFRTNDDPYQFVEGFFTTEDFEQFVLDHQLLFLEEASDELNKIYWMDSIFLLWDEELMTLELYKNLEAIKRQLQTRQDTENLPVFDPLAVFLEASPFQPAVISDSNIDDLKQALADNLAIAADQLDYSVASLSAIDHEVEHREIDPAFIRNNLIPLSIYLGETYLKTHNGSWIVKQMPGIDRPIPMLMTPEKRLTNVLNMVYGALTSKHGDLILPTRIYRLMTTRPFTPHR
jgi:hypothetical protein